MLRNQGSANAATRRPRVSGVDRLDAIDGALRRLGVDLDDEDDEFFGGGDWVGDGRGFGCDEWEEAFERRRPRRIERKTRDPEVWREMVSAASEEMPPLKVPSGYKRDSRGTWRYARGGASVPGARDLGLDDLHAWGRRRGVEVLVSVENAQAHEELEWVLRRRGRENTAWVRARRGVVEAVSVSRDDWDAHAEVALGMWAPELQADRMLTVADVSARTGLGASTVRSYEARGVIPKAQVRLRNGTALWAEPIMRAWIEHRDRVEEVRRASRRVRQVI